MENKIKINTVQIGLIFEYDLGEDYGEGVVNTPQDCIKMAECELEHLDMASIEVNHIDECFIGESAATMGYFVIYDPKTHNEMYMFHVDAKSDFIKFVIDLAKKDNHILATDGGVQGCIDYIINVSKYFIHIPHNWQYLTR